MTRLGGLAGATLDQCDDLGELFDGALAAWRERGLDGTVDLRGELAARRAADIIPMELVVHGWDVATATGRPYEVDDAVVRHLLDAAPDIIPSRRGKSFADEVPAPPGRHAAGAADRLHRPDGPVPVARAAVADLSLDALVTGHRGGPRAVRWVYLQVLRELAHHCGHADILREQILAS